MDCSYCFEKDKNRARRISDKVLSRAVDFIMRIYMNNSSRILSINLNGGEPLITFDKIKHFIDRVRSRTDSAGLRPALYELSTNATLMESEMINYLKQHNTSYYVGFDGIKKSFDLNRKFYSNKKGGFETAYGNILKMIAEGVRPERITLNLVITDNNAEYLIDNVLFMDSISQGIRLSINIAYNCEWNGNSLRILKGNLGRLIEFYEQRIYKDNHFSMKFIDDRIRKLLYPRKLKPSEHCGAAKNCWTVLTDGNIIGCSMLAYHNKKWDDLIIGNVSKGIDPKRNLLFRDLLDSIDHTECKACGFFGSCMNHCIVNNILGSGDLTKVPRSFCETEKMIIYECGEIIMKLKRDRADILRSRYGFKVSS